MAAPTNAAVCEVARRTVKLFPAGDSDLHHLYVVDDGLEEVCAAYDALLLAIHSELERLSIPHENLPPPPSSNDHGTDVADDPCQALDDVDYWEYDCGSEDAGERADDVCPSVGDDPLDESSHAEDSIYGYSTDYSSWGPVYSKDSSYSAVCGTSWNNPCVDGGSNNDDADFNWHQFCLADMVVLGREDRLMLPQDLHDVWLDHRADSFACAIYGYVFKPLAPNHYPKPAGSWPKTASLLVRILHNPHSLYQHYVHEQEGKIRSFDEEV